jgi:hypothetical protein
MAGDEYTSTSLYGNRNDGTQGCCFQQARVR